MKVTIDNRRTVLEWWLYSRLNNQPLGITDPRFIRQLIDQAEDNLKKCDSELAQLYDEYVPQFC